MGALHSNIIIEMSEELFTEEEIKEDICSTMKRLFDRGLISALGGNISARIPGKKEFWITPSGVFKGQLEPNDLVKLDLDGNVLEGYLRPSIEWIVHATIYKHREDINAITSED